LHGNRVPHVREDEGECRRDVGDDQQWKRKCRAAPARGPDAGDAQRNQSDGRRLRDAIDAAAPRELLSRVQIVAAFDEEHTDRAVRGTREIGARFAAHVVERQRLVSPHRVELLTIVRRIDGHVFERLAASRAFSCAALLPQPAEWNRCVNQRAGDGARDPDVGDSARPFPWHHDRRAVAQSKNDRPFGGVHAD